MKVELKIIQAIKKKLNIEKVEIEKIFQDGNQIYYDGTYMFNLLDICI